MEDVPPVQLGWRKPGYLKLERCSTSSSRLDSRFRKRQTREGDGDATLVFVAETTIREVPAPLLKHTNKDRVRPQVFEEDDIISQLKKTEEDNSKVSS